MALIPRQEDIEDVGDITANLPTLQFESALSDQEKQVLHLRARSHALTVAACAQAVYFVSILNEARQIKSQLARPAQKRASRLLQETAPKDPLLVGIIGCGRLGSQLAQALLTFGEINPDELKISTRRPETLADLQQKGVLCTDDNQKVAASVHVLFLCVLPSQLPLVARQIKGSISVHCTIYSLVSATTLTRLERLFEYTNIVRPEFHWDQTEGSNWNYTLDVSSIFSNRDMLEITCPLSAQKKDKPVTPDVMFAAQLIYAFVNMCTKIHLNIKETLNVIHVVIFGQTDDKELQDHLDKYDVMPHMPQTQTAFPNLSLTALGMTESSLHKKLVTSPELRNAFVEKYCSVFSQYLHWKNFAAEQDR